MSNKVYFIGGPLDGHVKFVDVHSTNVIIKALKPIISSYALNRVPSGETLVAEVVDYRLRHVGVGFGGETIYIALAGESLDNLTTTGI